jgi:hypothetical protein
MLAVEIHAPLARGDQPAPPPVAAMQNAQQRTQQNSVAEPTKANDYWIQCSSVPDGRQGAHQDNQITKLTSGPRKPFRSTGEPAPAAVISRRHAHAKKGRIATLNNIIPFGRFTAHRAHCKDFFNISVDFGLPKALAFS